MSTLQAPTNKKLTWKLQSFLLKAIIQSCSWAHLHQAQNSPRVPSPVQPTPVPNLHQQHQPGSSGGANTAHWEGRTHPRYAQDQKHSCKVCQVIQPWAWVYLQGSLASLALCLQLSWRAGCSSSAQMPSNGKQGIGRRGTGYLCLDMETQDQESTAHSVQWATVTDTPNPKAYLYSNCITCTKNSVSHQGFFFSFPWCFQGKRTYIIKQVEWL